MASIRNTRLFGAVAAVVIPLALAYVGGYFDVRERTAKLEGQVAPSKQAVVEQEETISTLQCKIKRLERAPAARKRIKC